MKIEIKTPTRTSRSQTGDVEKMWRGLPIVSVESADLNIPDAAVEVRINGEWFIRGDACQQVTFETNWRRDTERMHL